MFEIGSFLTQIQNRSGDQWILVALQNMSGYSRIASFDCCFSLLAHTVYTII